MPKISSLRSEEMLRHFQRGKDGRGMDFADRTFGAPLCARERPARSDRTDLSDRVEEARPFLGEAGRAIGARFSDF